MLQKKKCTVSSIQVDNDLLEIPNYNKVVSEITEANQTLDSSSSEFHEIIDKLPPTHVTERSNESIISINKNMLGMLVIQVEVGSDRLNFIFDTGAQISCINTKHMKNLQGIKSTDEMVNVGDAFGKFREMEVVLVDEIEVLGMKVKNLPMLSLSEEQLSLRLFGHTVYDIDGILGWDVIKLVDFDLDYVKQEIRLLEPQTEEVDYNFIQSAFPVVVVTDDSDGLRTFGVDTGAKKSWINERLVDECNLKVLKVLKKKKYGAHGVAYENVSLVKSFSIQIIDHEISFKNILTGYTKLLNTYEFDGVLGIDLIKNNIVRFSNSSGTMKLL